uniref:Mitochondrial nucleoid factor 1 n=1 Tax=Vombatus ursinus TaxID=29139 RepID=A0A4X2M1E2_VOMUR
MAASCYQHFLKLSEEWPLDETKRGRDLGDYLQQWVAQAFWEGENTQIAEYYKHKYPRPRDTGFSGLTVEECRIVLTLEEFKKLNKGLWKKLQDKLTTNKGIQTLHHCPRSVP